MLKSFHHPKSIGSIGASQDVTKIRGRMLRILIDSGAFLKKWQEQRSGASAPWCGSRRMRGLALLASQLFRSCTDGADLTDQAELDPVLVYETSVGAVDYP